MNDLLERLAMFWHSQGTEPGTGATEEEIASFEARYGLTFPPDLRTYFATVNGMAHGRDTFDNEMISLWRLSDVAIEYEEGPRAAALGKSHDVIIGDFMIGSHFFAALLSDPAPRVTPTFLLHGAQVFPVAESFAEFLERYLARDKVFYGWV